MIKAYISKNSYLLAEKKKQLYSLFKEKGFEVFYFDSDSFSMEEFIPQIESASLFSRGKKVVFLKDCLGLIKEKDLSAVKKVAAFDVIFFEELRKKIPEKITALFDDIEIIKEIDVRQWAKKFFLNFGREINDEALDYLLANCGEDMWLIDNCARKIILFAGDRKNINLDDVACNVPEKFANDIFSTLSFIFKDKKKGLRFLMKHIRKGDSPLFLLSMIEYQLRTILEYLEAKEKRVFLPKSFKYRNMANLDISLEKAKKLYQELFSLDFQIKMGIIDQQIALEKIFYKI